MAHGLCILRAVMPARSMWKGSLRIAKHELKFKLYAAVEDAAVRFHLLHAADEQRVEQRMVHSETAEAIPPDAIHKAFEVESGTLVLLTDEELAALVPEPSRDVDVYAFVPEGAIGPTWYERPYFIGPDGDAAEYAALARALRETKRVGLARWVMRNKRYNGALRAEGDHLVLLTLHSREEVVEAPKLTLGEGAADERELKMAKQLVSALEGDFEPSKFENHHRERLMELIQAKAKGKKLPKRRAQKKAAPSSLSGALRASLGHVNKERRSA
jgi:DNA end-binding protein Ku